MKEILLQWEEDNLRHFIVKDQRYLDNLESRWNEYHQSKEQEKIKRVRHSIILRHTAMFGQNFIIKQIIIWGIMIGVFIPIAMCTNLAVQNAYNKGGVFLPSGVNIWPEEHKPAIL